MKQSLQRIFCPDWFCHSLPCILFMGGKKITLIYRPLADSLAKVYGIPAAVILGVVLLSLHPVPAVIAVCLIIILELLAEQCTQNP